MASDLSCFHNFKKFASYHIFGVTLNYQFFSVFYHSYAFGHICINVESWNIPSGISSFGAVASSEVERYKMLSWWNIVSYNTFAL